MISGGEDLSYCVLQEGLFGSVMPIRDAKYSDFAVIRCPDVSTAY
jgi:hypothetical protein